jgi:peptidoglycan hydrolase-like protein with peptidoglycan-binding domain
MEKISKATKEGANVKAIQAALIKAKLACGVGGACGDMNADTAHALRQFQAMKRLPVTGRVDRLTAEALGVEWKGGD